SGPLNSPGAWKLDIDLTAGADPTLQYSVYGNNETGGPLAFSISITTPLLLGPYNRVSSQINGSVTDGNGNGASVMGTTQMALSNGSGAGSGAFACAAGSSATAACNGF